MRRYTHSNWGKLEKLQSLSKNIYECAKITHSVLRTLCVVSNIPPVHIHLEMVKSTIVLKENVRTNLFNYFIIHIIYEINVETTVIRLTTKPTYTTEPLTHASMIGTNSYKDRHMHHLEININHKSKATILTTRQTVAFLISHCSE